MAGIWIRRDGVEDRFSLEEVEHFLNNGQLVSDDLARYDESEEWVLLRDLLNIEVVTAGAEGELEDEEEVEIVFAARPEAAAVSSGGSYPPFKPGLENEVPVRLRPGGNGVKPPDPPKPPVDNPIPGAAHQLRALSEQAAARRRNILGQRDSVRSYEAMLRNSIQTFTDQTSGNVNVSHPLAGQIGATVPDAFSNLGAALDTMHHSRNKVAAARQALGSAHSELQALEQRRSTLLKVGGFMLSPLALLFFLYENGGAVAVCVGIAVVGFVIMIRGGQTEGISAAQGAVGAAKQEEAAERRRLDSARERALQEFSRIQDATTSWFRKQMADDTRKWNAVWQYLPPFLRADWDESNWESHDFQRSYRLPHLLMGLAYERESRSGEPYVMPILGPFLGKATTIRMEGEPEHSLSMMHGLILQLATALPFGATFTLLDPSGAGRAFPMQRALPVTRKIGADLYRDLEPVLEDVSDIIRTYLDDTTRSFDQLPEQVQATKRYEFIFAANFPENYDRRTIEILQRIAANGPLAGKYLFLQMAKGRDLPRDLNWADFKTVETFNASTPPAFNLLPGCDTVPLACPQDGNQSRILAILGLKKPEEAKVSWEQMNTEDPAHWWTQESSKQVLAPIGSSGRDRTLDIWFGANDSGRPCAHGVLGAMTGSGKSNLYHVLITGLALRYSPRELNLFLIDGKMGVEFKPYRGLPHARVVALNSAPELSRSVLAEMLNEMQRRNEIFKQCGVTDLSDYRKKGSPKGKLPRVVLMIDEYQELFEDDREGQASASLLQLAQQGRSAGLHMLLASQRFGAVGMLHQASIFGNVHLRMAMQMSNTDVMGLTEFGRNGKRLVEQCDLPGKIVINDQSGDDTKNEFGKVAYLNREILDRLLSDLRNKAKHEINHTERFATVVFDGQEQPNVSENPQILNIIHQPKRPDDAGWQKIASASPYEHGFGIPDWFGGECPMALWIGQELNVHGQARIILRRRSMENVIIVGENQAAIYGMLAGALCSLAVNLAPSRLRLWIGDRAVPGTPWQKLIPQTVEALLRGYDVQLKDQTKDILSWLDAWCGELDIRSGMDENEVVEKPTWIMILAGADRIPPLARTQTQFGGMQESPQGQQLRRIYQEGPALGLHLILSFPAISPLRQCLERNQIDQFKHRVATQMSEADSFFLLGKDFASKLQRGEPKPIFATYQDTGSGTDTKFKPYILDAQIPWEEQWSALSEYLNQWV